jgi:hypothetical protein
MKLGSRLAQILRPLLVIAGMAALAGTAAGEVGSSALRAAPAMHCRSLKHVVARSTRLAVAFDGDIKTCDRRTGHTRYVGTDYPFGPPARAISVVGHLVGFAADVEGDGDMPNHTVIRIADLRHHKRLADGFLQRWGLTMGLPYDYPVKIGSLAIDAHRRAAWIECPEADRRATGSARPNCIHPGDTDTVQLLPSPAAIKPGSANIAAPTQIATGTNIDPRYVRLTQTRVVWTQGNRTRSRRLPPLRSKGLR